MKEIMLPYVLIGSDICVTFPMTIVFYVVTIATTNKYVNKKRNYITPVWMNPTEQLLLRGKMYSVS